MSARARAELAALAERGLDLSSGFAAVGSDARAAAVLVLFGELDGVPDIDAEPAFRNVDLLLLRRSSTLRTHAGQVAFPGGRTDPGETAVEAALREAVEETGLDPSGVEVLGELPAIPAIVSNHLVVPVLAWWTRASEVVAVDHAETVEVFRVPVADLLDPANRVTAFVERMGMTFRSPGYLVADTLVWGFTGLMLDQLLTELGWTEPWDTERLYPVPSDMMIGRG